jgi:hypothetical protein
VAEFGVMSETRSVAGLPVADSWIQDVANLGVRLVRLKINIGAPVAEYQPVLQRYRDRQLTPVVVFTGGPPDLAPNAALGPGPLPGDPPTNAYIDFYARTVAERARQLSGVVEHFEIYNEPNNKPTPDDPVFMEPRNFGSLLYYSADYIKFGEPGRNVPVGNDHAVVISGGLIYICESNVRANQIDGMNEYLDAVYKSDAVTRWFETDPNHGYPWDHLGIHTYGTPRSAGRVLDKIRDLKAHHLDMSPLWLTEFGDWRDCITSDCADPASGNAQADVLADWYDVVQKKPYVGASFWFCHHQFHDPALDPARPNGHYGLTGHDIQDGTITAEFHWPAWQRLRSIIQP